MTDNDLCTILNPVCRTGDGLRELESSGGKSFSSGQLRADLLRANAVQNIAPQEGKTVHGRIRQAGAQNEAYLHCHRGFDSGAAPGRFNDWLVAWPEAFCRNTAERMREEIVRK